MLQGMYITGNMRNKVSTFMIKEAQRLHFDIITATFISTKNPKKNGSTANL